MTPLTSDTAQAPARRAELTVVICSLNGSAGVVRCLEALRHQTVVDAIEVLVVDDGSTDDTAAAAESQGVRVLRHERNRGLAAARNTAIAAAATRLIAFLDDDCVPDDNWAEMLLEAWKHAAEGVVGIGGIVLVDGPDTFVTGYLSRHNPLEPLEIDLAQTPAVGYRFVRYLARNWSQEKPTGTRPVFSLVGANMSFTVAALNTVGGFDAAMRFGSEDLDMSMRLRSEFGDACLLVAPSARVRHYFKGDLGDTLRRARAYGRGHLRMLRKHREMNPTVFPLPVGMAVLLAAGLRIRPAWLAALALPHLVHPGGLRAALSGRPSAAFDAYVSLGQEIAYTVGMIGLWLEEPAADRGLGWGGRQAVRLDERATVRPR